ncbi:MAG: PqqD family protein [Armatimonadetes bacterium]|nr:PqqD family protein [Armatimonadota bacterium]
MQGSYTDRFKWWLGRYLPFLKMHPPIDRNSVLYIRPIRNQLLEWERTETGETRLKVPRRKDWIGRLISRWYSLPDSHVVEIDEVGSFVWQLCDGNHTVEAIVRETANEYKLNRREVEISVTTFLQTLGERRFIGFFKRSEASQ